MVFVGVLLRKVCQNSRLHNNIRMSLLLQRVSDRVNKPPSLSQEGLECPICLEELFKRSSSAAKKFKWRSDDRREAQQMRGAQGTAETTGSLQQVGDEAGAERPSKASESCKWVTKNVRSLQLCDHLFHGRCLLEWMSKARQDCPVCRIPFWGSAYWDMVALRATRLSQESGEETAQSVLAQAPPRETGESWSSTTTPMAPPAVPPQAYHYRHQGSGYIGHLSPAQAAAFAANVV